MSEEGEIEEEGETSDENDEDLPPPPMDDLKLPPPKPIIDEDLEESSEFEKLKVVETPQDLSKYLTIVVISDTHGNHGDFNVDKFPTGDVLIHCGDFMDRNQFKDEEKWRDNLFTFNNFLGKLPHKHKFCICGNHGYFSRKDINIPKKEIQKYLSNAIYLEDSKFTIDIKKDFPSKKFSKKQKKINVFGSPWTNAIRMGYCVRRDQLKKKWNKIQKNSHILVSHLPPFNIMDLAMSSSRKKRRMKVCEFCKKKHPNHKHWGCSYLRDRTEYLNKKGKLKLHCFGHNHDNQGIWIHKKTEMTYINGSCPNPGARTPVVYYYPLAD